MGDFEAPLESEIHHGERIAVLETNRDNDVRRISRLESSVDRIVLAGWVIAGSAVIQTVNAMIHR